MLSKKYLPNLGFSILLTTILCSVLFVRWSLEPLSYEKADDEEKKGHQLARDGNPEEASKHFLAAAQIEDDNISTSRRYRCAGSTTGANNQDKKKYYKLALKYNPNNQDARNELKLILNTIEDKKAGNEELRGYQLARDGNYKEASKHFLAAAQIQDDNISISRRYGCAGNTSANNEDKKKYFKLALKYNPNNQNAKNGLRSLLTTIKKVGN